MADLHEIDAGLIRTAPCREVHAPVAQLRWNPVPIDEATPTTWLTGLRTIAANGDAHLQRGAATHLYFATESMVDEVFVDADGELLIIPEVGGLRLVTEFGVITVSPQEIGVVPRGAKFRVELLDGAARGYVCENYGAAFTCPSLGLSDSTRLLCPETFCTRSPPTSLTTGPLGWCSNTTGACSRPILVTHRSMWSPGMATTRPTNMTFVTTARSARCCLIIRTLRSGPC